MNSHDYIKRRLKSFNYAFNGLRLLVREEPNSIIHCVIGVVVIVLGFLLAITAMEWIAIIISIGFVFVMELINTSIENICDFISPAQHIQIKRIKDLAAAGVLVSAIIAVMVGLIVFIPRIV